MMIMTIIIGFTTTTSTNIIMIIVTTSWAWCSLEGYSWRSPPLGWSATPSPSSSCPGIWSSRWPCVVTKPSRLSSYRGQLVPPANWSPQSTGPPFNWSSQSTDTPSQLVPHSTGTQSQLIPPVNWCPLLKVYMSQIIIKSSRSSCLCSYFRACLNITQFPSTFSSF